MAIESAIRQTIEKELRPYIQGHGGDIRLAGYTDGVAEISLTGACAGCPSADLGTKAMVEEVLRRKYPEIRGVELSRHTSDEMMDFISKILSHEVTLD